ncbi:MAG: sodium:solute symporter [Chitinophagaceae bacterium]|nr:sodium:solute symporter [Chitinophagaceae bacterium]MCW5926058.1 sodium:solute symporter [Chitinophagaceae bacterium]
MIEVPDLIICVGYIMMIVCVGLWIGLKKKAPGKGSASEEYFLAGKTLRWPMIGLALFATNISCIHLVSLAQSGFDTGLLNGNFEWMASLVLILLALFFVPFYIKSGVPTLPVFLSKRYNQACRDWLTVISIISAIIIHIAFSLLAGGIVLETLFGINMYISVTVISLLVAIYTMVGGLKAVVITESIQTIVLVGGAIVITWVSFSKLGSWGTLVDTLQQQNAMDKLSMLRPHGDASGMPWYAVFLGYPILGIWYWCADQTIVQRVLGARDENHARAGALFCGFIKILPVFIFVVPGLLAYALMHKGVLDVSAVTTIDSNGESVVNSKGIYTIMISQLLPTGLLGIVVAALLSGLMSQVAGALNSISTLVSYDLYKRFRPEAEDRQLVKLGRMSVLVALMFSIGLLPLLNSYESLFNGFNDVIAHIAPPITCVFLTGIFWRKASALSAQYTLWLGSVLGGLVFTLNKVWPESWFDHTPFMMMAFYLFCACLLIQVVLSFVFPVVHTDESEKLIWKHPLDPLRARGWRGIANYKFQAGLLAALMIVLYIYFG